MQTCSSSARARSVDAHVGVSVRSAGLGMQKSLTASVELVTLVENHMGGAIWPPVDRRTRAAFSFGECLRTFVEVVCSCAVKQDNASR